jgi:uncharacterized spore protein YtfJ
VVTEVTHDSSPFEVLQGVRERLTASTSIGEPVRTPDVTIIPMVRVAGGGGGGAGIDHHGDADAEADQGGGAGFGLQSRPVGAFVVRGSRVTWRPATDVNRIVLGGQIVGAVAILVAGTIIREMIRAGRDRRLLRSGLRHLQSGGHPHRGHRHLRREAMHMLMRRRGHHHPEG